MEPIAVWVQTNGEWSLVHRCGSCKVARVNRAAGDDDAFVLLSLAARPMARPPFPVDRLPK
jgi:ribosome biogenesis GTPase